MMKLLARYGLPVIFASACSWADEVTLLKPVDVPVSPAIERAADPKDRGSNLHACTVGEKLGTVETVDTDLATLTTKALAHDQSQDPFFGPGYEFILRDSKGQHFIVFFEYEKGHKTFDGFRAAIAPLKKVKTRKGIFAGNPYRGATFDKDLLRQLKTFVDRLPEKE